MTNFLPSIKTSFTFCIEFDFDWELSLLMLDAQVLWNDVGAMPVDIFLFRELTLGFLQSSFDAGIKSAESFIFEKNGIISGGEPGGMCCCAIVCFNLSQMMRFKLQNKMLLRAFFVFDLQNCALLSVSGSGFYFCA